MTNHTALQEWVKDMAAMCEPDEIVWLDGSAEQLAALKAEAISTGEVTELDQEKMPGCIYHRTAQNDVARTEGLTFICTTKEENAGPTNHWMPPEEGYAKAREIFAGSMKGRTMYVIPFSMGPVGSDFSKIGVELTDSIYVVLNMDIMTRIGQPVLDVLGSDGEFTRCLHGKAERDIKRRLILHFPEDNAIWSVGSGYGGNVLLGKKCLALRIASHLGHQEGWMAEHMLIMGIEHPDGRIDYVAGAFPSACGKTNLAMLVPPKDLADAGYKVWTLGDDIAWMRVGDDGRLWAINPESGCFGVVPGTNSKSNPSAMEMVKTNTIYTNTMLADDGTTWWEGHDEDPPAHGLDWKGEEWVPGKKDDHGHAVPGAHPNSRFTAPMSQCPSVAPNWEDPKGVPISAIMFGARRARLAPLIVESSSWEHAVYLGANMTSERTAAQRGTVGEVRRDPMAMLPFCGYNMADYFQHWLDMGKRLTQQPKVFRVNWFRCSEEGEFLWPGFGENLRVLLWMLARARGEADAVESPIGNVPTYESFEWAGLDYARETFEELMDIDVQEWLVEDAENKQFLAQFGDRLPQELREQHAAREQRLRDAD